MRSGDQRRFIQGMGRCERYPDHFAPRAFVRAFDGHDL